MNINPTTMTIELIANFIINIVKNLWLPIELVGINIFGKYSKTGS